MVNFVFNEGAAAALSGDIDWLGSEWDCSVYDNTITPDVTDTMLTVSSGIRATLPMKARLLTTAGAASADPIEFIDVSPGPNNGTLPGIIIKRNSDNLLLVHIDEGFDGLGNSTSSAGAFMNVKMKGLTYTFTLRPGVNNESAWFRL